MSWVITNHSSGRGPDTDYIPMGQFSKLLSFLKSYPKYCKRVIREIPLYPVDCQRPKR